MVAELAGQHRDGQRQVPAQPGQLADRGVPGAQPGPGRQPGQQGRRLPRRQGVQADLGGILQSGEPTAAGHQHQAPAVPGSSGRTCSCPAASSSSSRIFWPATASRHRAARASSPGGICAAARPDRQQQAGQRIGRVDRPLPGRVGVQRQEELPVREARRQPVGGVHGERGLADPGHPVDRVNARHLGVNRPRGQILQQPRQFALAAGEAGRIARQGPGGRGRGGSWPRVMRGRQHLRRGPPAPGRGDEQRAGRLGQAQCAGQQPGGILAGRAVDSPLQVADRPRGQARRLGQLLLGQLGFGPQLPQQSREPRSSLLCHPPLRLSRARRDYQPSVMARVVAAALRPSRPAVW